MVLSGESIERGSIMQRDEIISFLEGILDSIPKTHAYRTQRERIEEALAIINGSYIKRYESKAIMLNEIVKNAVNDVIRLERVKNRPNITIKTYFRSRRKVKCIPHIMEIAIRDIVLNSLESIKESGVIYITTEETETTGYVYIQDSGPDIGSFSMDCESESFLNKDTVSLEIMIRLLEARSVIEDFGGGIDIQTSPEQGKIFVIKLPVCKDESSTTKKKIPKNLCNKSVLIIDDECILNNLIGEALKSKGIHVYFCASMPEAERFLKRKSVDLIITESRDPDSEAGEIISTIKGLRKGTGVLILTNREPDKVNMDSFISDSVISTPIHMELLLGRIYDLLSS